MALEAVWKSETGEELGTVDDVGGFLSAVALKRVGFAGTTCVRFLDPHGDTVFNRLQLPVLAQELDVLAAATKDRAVRDHLSAVAELARRAAGEIHTYLWFIGD
jgi:hypothetical protein